MSSPITGEEQPGSVVAGLVTLFVTGVALGSVLPTNHALPTPWYRILSSCLGYTYFLCWSISFYPQVLTNFRRRTTIGLSADFAALNVLGFACYSAYNVALYTSPSIHQQYKHRYGPHAEITVQSNDVAFAVHALVLSAITLCQIAVYDGLHPRQFSKFILGLIVCMVAVMVVTPVLISTKFMVGTHYEWLDYMYLLSYLKIVVTLVKYIPQMILNFRRKSTTGWSIWQILLDFSGGLLSDLQLVGDCFDLKDWTGLTGNLAKFFLGFVSILFDTVFMLQHYVWYPESGRSFTAVGEMYDADNNDHVEPETSPML